MHRVFLVLLACVMMADVNAAMRLVKSMSMRATTEGDKDSGAMMIAESESPTAIMMDEASSSGATVDEETPAPGSPSRPATIIWDESGSKGPKWVLKSHVDNVSCCVVNTKTKRTILDQVELVKDKSYPLDAQLHEEMLITYKWPVSPKRSEPKTSNSLSKIFRRKLRFDDFRTSDQSSAPFLPLFFP